MKIGILFGGQSREREVSFAGGRTVYDNLDKNIFEPVPIFVDSLGNFILLEWQYIYKGTIRDFYPPVMPTEDNPFQVYVESLKYHIHDEKKCNKLIEQVGKRVYPHQFSSLFDFAFLTLHGAYGEDGNIQGILEWYNIPYSGSGILPSAIGVDKITQSQVLANAGFKRPKQQTISLHEWEHLNHKQKKILFGKLVKKIKLPLVIKSPHQGSSIGVSIVSGEWKIEKKKEDFLAKNVTENPTQNITNNITQNPAKTTEKIATKRTQKSKETFAKWEKAVNKSFFRQELHLSTLKKMPAHELRAFLNQLTDIRENIGFPMMWAVKEEEKPTKKIKKDKTTKKKNNHKIQPSKYPNQFYYQENQQETTQEQNGKNIIYSPQELEYLIKNYFPYIGVETFFLQAMDMEPTILFEEFITGKEFSCIVIQNENNEPVALPPTEIRKFKEVFDYRSKYLPGTSSKVTPIEIDHEHIQKIRKACQELYLALHANVYARIDGFITPKNEIFLNDPNTTSGMLPSSFFFHQSAEIGLDSKDFLTYIIRTSLYERKKTGKNGFKLQQLLSQLDKKITENKTQTHQKTKVAVIMGGYSSERHISMESGRNVYEKLASSTKYAPFPVFLMGNEHAFELYQLPLNYMLKDNADDIAKKIKHTAQTQNHQHPIITQIKKEFEQITRIYASQQLEKPINISLEQLAQKTQLTFIALHGRPGEDGALQQGLDKYKIAYNGSGVESSQTTINKYQTNEILAKNHILVAKHTLVYENDWQKNKNEILENINKNFQFPLIAKPADDGCSSAVKKLKNVEQLCAFAEMMFRKEEPFLEHEAKILALTPKEEFPQKNYFLVEELITKGDKASHFLEITGGMLTHITKNEQGENVLNYEVFPPSEALATGDVLSLEEKFLAGEGQNITPARYYPTNADINKKIELETQKVLERTARILQVEGYCRIDAFVRVFEDKNPEIIIIEVNSLPGMTPATCIFHQASLHGYKPYQFMDKILDFGVKRISH